MPSSVLIWRFGGLKLQLKDPEEILGKDIHYRSFQSKTCLWLVTICIGYNLKQYANGNVTSFQQYLYDKRWNSQKFYKKSLEGG